MSTIQDPLSVSLESSSVAIRREAEKPVGPNIAESVGVTKSTTENIASQSEVKRNDVVLFDAENKNSQNEKNSLDSNNSEQDQTTIFEEIEKSLQQINDFIPVNSTNLIFEFDELGEPPVVKVIDKLNDEVIREIPPQEIREVAKAFESLADKLNIQTGILVDDSA